MKILIVFGTRPEAIKMAPLVKLLEIDNRFEVRVLVTAQHREMLDQVLELFEITPDYDLNIMHPAQDLYELTSRILLGMRDVFKKYRPDLVLVHGDTATCFVATLASFYMQIPVGHVEAGLRTGDMYSPWPEEANRVLVGRLATLHFAPTELNKLALINEGVDANKIAVTGNTVIDALHLVIKKIENSNKQQLKINDDLKKAGLDWIINGGRYVLVTGHRRENFGKGFENICLALFNLAKNNPNVNFIYPAHLNPNVQEPVKRILSTSKNIHLIKPLGYEPFVYLMQNCYLVLTDSGGIQEEAPGLGKPVLVMRNSTERPEGLEAGTVKLVGTTPFLIEKEVQKLLNDEVKYKKMSFSHNPYGTGNSSKAIIDFIIKSKIEIKC